MSAKTVFTVPNLITGARILATPFVVYFLTTDQYLLAFWLFFAAGLTDWLDGFLARFYNQSSFLGQLLDPLADKILIMAVSIGLYCHHQMPLWLFLPILCRDVFLMIGSLLIGLKRWDISLKPVFISKLNTLLQIMVCLSLLGKNYFAAVPAWFSPFLTTLFCATLMTTVLSGWSYAWLFYQGLRKP